MDHEVSTVALYCRFPGSGDFDTEVEINYFIFSRFKAWRLARVLWGREGEPTGAQPWKTSGANPWMSLVHLNGTGGGAAGAL